MTTGPQSVRSALRAWLGLLTAALCLGQGDRLRAQMPAPVGQPAHFFHHPLSEPPLIGIPAPPTVVAAPLEVEPQGLQDPPPPVVAIRVRVIANGAAGQELEYRICVQNLGACAAHHVLVRDPLPANACFVRAMPEPAAREPELLWPLGSLRGGECREIVLVLCPSGTGDVLNCARVQFEHGQCVCTRIARHPLTPPEAPLTPPEALLTPPEAPLTPPPVVPRPVLQLQKHGPEQAVLNQTLAYQVTVTNAGDAEAADVVLTDTLPPGLEHSSGKNQLVWDIGKLGPGQSRTIDYQVVARQAGRLCNRVTATAAGGLREEMESCVTVAEAKMALSKTGPGRLYVSRPAAYQLTVTNTGTVPLTGVRLSDPIPEQATFASATQGGQLVGNEVQWSIGTLAPGTSRTVELVFRARVAGTICNRATASAEQGLTAQADTCTEFVGVAALLLEVVDTDDPVELGAETSYVILVRNQGTLAATNIRLTATVPTQMGVVRVVGPTDNRKDGQKIVFEPLTLAPGTDGRYQVFVKALEPGDVRFRVEMTADQLTSGLPVVEEESTTIYRDLPSSRKKQPRGEEAQPMKVSR